MTIVSFSKIQERRLWIVISFILLLNFALWFSFKAIQGKWTNVPPAPSVLSALGFGIGDASFAYRGYGLILQNLGDFGGRSTSLKDYNYENLGEWLLLLNRLDSKSEYLPFLASYYFGAVDDPSKLKPVIDYLEIKGNSPEGENWRWLAYAVYLARFKMNDLDRALEIANKLYVLQNPGIPQWARNMPANVLNAKGDKEAAYDLLIGILKNSADKLKPNEVNATIGYICEQILTPEQAKINSLCQGND